MPTSYIPTRDVDLDAWAANFSAVITAAPTDYGLDAGQASALATLVTTYTNALAAATNPSTRTSVTVAAKDTARNQLVALCRQYGRVAQAYPGITDELLADAGLTVRDPVPSPIPAPVTTPVLSLLDSSPLQHVIRFKDSDLSNPRAMPPGVTGMRLFAKKGGTVPASIAECAYVGTYSRMPAVVGGEGSQYIFAGADGGESIHYMALWQTRRGLVGPVSQTMTETLPA